MGNSLMRDSPILAPWPIHRRELIPLIRGIPPRGGSLMRDPPHGGIPHTPRIHKKIGLQVYHVLCILLSDFRARLVISCPAALLSVFCSCQLLEAPGSSWQLLAAPDSS